MVYKLIEKVKKDISKSSSLANKEILNFGLDGQDTNIGLASILLAKRMAEERLKFNLESIYPKDLRCDDIDVVNLGCNLFAESLNKYKKGNSDFIGRNELNEALNCIVCSFVK